MNSDMNGSDKETIFVCSQCGFCCHGETTVSLDENDQARMVRTLGLDRSEVERRFWRVTAGVVQMKTVNGHCIFYDNGCTIHPGRPWRCAQWPLVPALLQDENNFKIISESCPGLNRKLLYAEFCRILASYLEDKLDTPERFLA